MLRLSACPELLTPREMSGADSFAIKAGTPGISLMDRAGLAVARVAAQIVRTRGRVHVLCGTGGNGGDGFSAARQLAAWGYPVRVFLLGDKRAMREDSAEMARRWNGAIEAADTFDPRQADLIVDALFGAGLSRDLDGLAADCVGRVNAFAKGGGRVVAVDVPSGLDGETGEVRGIAVDATATVTFFRLKPGHLLSSGGGQTGKIAFADIGMPRGALDEIRPTAFANTPAVWRDELPKLGSGSNKYTRGAALIASGTGNHTGAARLSARAALRIGAGLVTLACPADAVAVNAAHETAVMLAPFGDDPTFAKLLEDPRRNSILIGPGAGIGEATRAHVEAALAGPGEARRAVTLDADALTSFSGDAKALAELIASRQREVVITPHEGEFAKLFKGEAQVEGAIGNWPAPARRLVGLARSCCSRAPTPSSPRRTDAPPSAATCRRRWRPPAPATRSPASSAACSRRARHGLRRSERGRVAARRLRPRRSALD